MKKYKFLVEFTVEESEDEISQERLEDFLKLIPSRMEAEITDGPEEIEEDEEN